jgi:hypothetical protein
VEVLLDSRIRRVIRNASGSQEVLKMLSRLNLTPSDLPEDDDTSEEVPIQEQLFNSCFPDDSDETDERGK